MTQPIRGRATQDEILEAFAARLRSAVNGLNTATVVVSDQPVPSIMPAGGFLVTVAPGAGEFPHQLWANGHHATATEDGSVIVSFYMQSVKDAPGRKDSAILSSKPNRPSLMKWKRSILKALTVSDEPYVVSRHVWEPIKDGRFLLRDQPQPVRVTGILDVPEHKSWISFQMTFSCTWDWELYEDA